MIFCMVAPNLAVQCKATSPCDVAQRHEPYEKAYKESNSQQTIANRRKTYANRDKTLAGPLQQAMQRPDNVEHNPGASQ